MDINAERQVTATEAKALVALAFRIGPIEPIHSSMHSLTSDDGQPDHRRITGPEMKGIMKYAVDQMYRLLRLKLEDPTMYESEIRRGAEFTATWDEPAGAPGAPTRFAAENVPAKLPEGGVLVTIPLSPLRALCRNSTDGPSWAELRNRLEDLIGFIGLFIEKRGLATAHQCGVERNRLNLLLAGDSAAIAKELRIYFQFLNLPESKIVMFADGSSEPVEMSLGTDFRSQL